MSTAGCISILKSFLPLWSGRARAGLRRRAGPISVDGLSGSGAGTLAGPSVCAGVRTSSLARPGRDNGCSPPTSQVLQSDRIQLLPAPPQVTHLGEVELVVVVVVGVVLGGAQCLHKEGQGSAAADCYN